MTQTIQQVLEECEEVKRLLEHKHEEIKAQEALKDLDAQRRDWERQGRD